MRTARASETFDATVAEAESCWYDTTRWHLWVDGLDRVVEVDGAWPETGATVTWQSGPAGRGTVVERVIAHEPLLGQALEVKDGSIRGRQSVAFAPAPPGVEVSLALEYELLRRSIVTPVVDLLFIKRAMAASLAQTVSRFGAELAAARETR
ncbi:MAG TPA: SRPBCC family protein [Solirubrobacteraceae bacterium]|nr:SRPBCC family protein [Solirubrobacteraceae bacterium]